LLSGLTGTGGGVFLGPLLLFMEGPYVAWMAYRPMTWLTFNGPEPLRRNLKSYMAFCTSDQFVLVMGLEEPDLIYEIDGSDLRRFARPR